MFAARLARAVALLGLLAAVHAQLATVIDAGSGNTVVVSIATDVDGDPIATAIVSTLTPVADDAAAEETPADADAADTAMATDTATATSTTATEQANLGQPAVVQQPASRCTTAGCPVAPTTYTQNGAIVTWFATTPATPIPTWTSSGEILQAGNYITSTASGATGRATGAGNGSSSRHSLPFSSRTDWGIALGVALVGGMVGAVAVL
ncbi:hypothetical protein JCM10207_005533 [Rhodosporidiobolus poonsookiae]